MRYFFRLALVPLLFSAAYSADPDHPGHGEVHGVVAQNIIAALVNGSNTLQHYIFRTKDKKIRFTVTDLSIRETDRLGAYVPNDGLYALPSAVAEGKLSRLDPAHPHEQFLGAMELYHAVSALNFPPESHMSRNQYMLKQLSCLIDRAATDMNVRFTCYYVPMK